jgi:CubicO group peptidase (beta-lactamase class C family)
MTSLEKAIEHIERFAQLKTHEANMPGMAIAITGREKLLRVATFGYADVASQAPIEAGSMFEIGSIGKSFTNIALLQLRDEGRLDVYAPVSRYLPWFEVQSDYGPITPHHLMSHTSGLVTGTEIAPHGYYESWALRETKTGAPPGECFRYSNIGYKTLGFLLEEVAGHPYRDVIQARVLDPLEMGGSHPVISFETRKRAAVGYRSFYDDRPEHRDHGIVPALWSEYGAGDGCQASTAEDMATYLRMFMNRGSGSVGRVISEESFALMTQHVIETQQWGGSHYGYGITMAEVDGHAYLGHAGSTPGYVAAIIADMVDGLGVVVLVNGYLESYGAVEIATHVLKLLRAGQHQQEIPAPPSVTDPASVNNAGEYAGTYSANGNTLDLVAQGERLLLKYGGLDVALEKRGGDSFYVGHPDLEPYLLEFGRDGDRVVEAFHGAGWYTGGDYSGPTSFDYPKEWECYPGHYRAHNPGLSNFRVVLRKGALLLVFPTGGNELLVPLGDSLFRIGEDQRSPETLRFDALAGGRALRADYSGCPYYRTYTP